MYKVNVVQVDCLDSQGTPVPHGQCAIHRHHISAVYQENYKHDPVLLAVDALDLPSNATLDTLKSSLREKRDEILASVGDPSRSILLLNEALLENTSTTAE